MVLFMSSAMLGFGGAGGGGGGSAAAGAVTLAAGGGGGGGGACGAGSSPPQAAKPRVEITMAANGFNRIAGSSRGIWGSPVTWFERDREEKHAPLSRAPMGANEHSPPHAQSLSWQ